MRNGQRSLSEKLLAASASGDIAAMRKLIAEGADVNCPDKQGFTPLMLVAYNWRVNGDFSAGAALLIKSGARLDDANSGGHTALMISSIYGLADMVKMLLAAGADLDKKSPARLTAEDMAQKNGHADIVALLQQTRASRNIAERRERLKNSAQRKKKKGFRP